MIVWVSRDSEWLNVWKNEPKLVYRGPECFPYWTGKEVLMAEEYLSETGEIEMMFGPIMEDQCKKFEIKEVK